MEEQYLRAEMLLQLAAVPTRTQKKCRGKQSKLAVASDLELEREFECPQMQLQCVSFEEVRQVVKM